MGNCKLGEYDAKHEKIQQDLEESVKSGQELQESCQKLAQKIFDLQEKFDDSNTSTESDGSGNTSLPWCQDTVNRMLVAMETIRESYKTLKSTEPAELSELKELCEKFQQEKMQVVSELENLKNCNSNLNSSIQGFESENEVHLGTLDLLQLEREELLEEQNRLSQVIDIKDNEITELKKEILDLQTMSGEFLKISTLIIEDDDLPRKILSKDSNNCDFRKELETLLQEVSHVVKVKKSKSH